MASNESSDIGILDDVLDSPSSIGTNIRPCPPLQSQELPHRDAIRLPQLKEQDSLRSWRTDGCKNGTEPQVSGQGRQESKPVDDKIWACPPLVPILATLEPIAQTGVHRSHELPHRKVQTSVTNRNSEAESLDDEVITIRRESGRHGPDGDTPAKRPPCPVDRPSKPSQKKETGLLCARRSAPPGKLYPVSSTPYQPTTQCIGPTAMSTAANYHFQPSSNVASSAVAHSEDYSHFHDTQTSTNTATKLTKPSPAEYLPDTSSNTPAQLTRLSSTSLEASGCISRPTELVKGEVRVPHGVRKKWDGLQWRPLCAHADTCMKRAIRCGLCHKHLPKNDEEHATGSTVTRSDGSRWKWNGCIWRTLCKNGNSCQALAAANGLCYKHLKKDDTDHAIGSTVTRADGSTWKWNGKVEIRVCHREGCKRQAKTGGLCFRHAKAETHMGK